MRYACGKMGKSALLSAMAVLLAFLIALLPVTPASAAGTWASQRTPLVESYFNDTYFLTGGGTGWAVGSPSTDFTTFYHHCWYTGDGGTTWTGQTIGNWGSIPALMWAHMEGVYFLDANNGYAVGQMGIISKCTDGAAGDWAVVRDGTAEEVLQDVVIFDATSAMVVGVNKTDPGDQSTWSPIVLRTADGGASWDDVDLNDTSFVTTTTGWAVGNGGTIINTINGGTTWTAQTSGTTSDLNAVYATSVNDAWAAGDSGTLLRTTDGGTSWSSDFDTNGVFSLDASNTWIVGQYGLILHYNSTTTTWTEQASGTTDDLNGVHFADATYGWAVGENNVNLYTTDGGTTWGPGPALAANLNDVYTYDNAGTYYIWICGDGGFYRHATDPGGGPAGWTTATTPPPVQDLLGIEFAGVNDGQVAGSSGTLASTPDSGDVWTNGTGLGTTNFTDVTYGGAAGIWFATAEDGGLWQTRDGSDWGTMDLYDVASPDANTNYYVGGGGTIIKRATTTWTVQDSGTSNDLYAVEFDDASYGWAVGESDTVLNTIDGGDTWTPYAAVGGVDWFDVSVVEQPALTYNVCVVGNSGNIRHCTHIPPAVPGAWAAPASAVSGNFLTVDFYDADIGWAMGSSGVAWHTRDGTEANPTWSETSLNDVFSVGASNTWWVGDGGTIIHYDGSNFTVQYNSTSWTFTTLNSVHFVDQDHGWAVGDGGWVIEYDSTAPTPGWQQPQQVGAPNPNLNAVFLTAAEAGFAVGDSGYYSQLTAGPPAWSAPAQVGAPNPNLNDVYLSDTEAGFAVGDSGNWSQLTAGPNWSAPALVGAPNPNLNAVFLTAAEAGFAVGDSGYYSQLTAGPPTWSAPALVGAPNPNLNDVYLSDTEDGWAVGGSSLTGYRVDIDAGPVFTVTSMDAAGSRGLTGIDFYDGTHAFLSGIWRTIWSYDSGGGLPWTNLSTIFTDADLDAFDMSDAGNGCLVGEGGKAFLLFDGCCFSQEDTGVSEDLDGVFSLDATNVWAVGRSGTIINTPDGGTNWNTQTSDTPNDLVGVEFNSATDGYVAGEGRTILSTSDGGTNWNIDSGVEPTTDDFYGLDFTDADNGWISGEGGKLYRYEDGKVSALTSGTTLALNGVSMYGAEGYAVGAQRLVLESADGGTTWTALSSLDVTDGINGASFTGAYEGWFAGDNGLILHYDNGIFEIQDPGGTSGDYMDISLVDDVTGDKGAAVGTNSTVRYTATNGATWSGASGVPLSTDINGVEFADIARGLFCGDGGIVYKSTDGGSNWAAPSTPPGTTEDLLGVTFGDAVNDDAWAVGTGGVVYRSIDQGDVWAAQTSNTANGLNGVEALWDGVDEYYCWAVGEGRTIMNTVTLPGNPDTWAAQLEVPGPGGLFGIDKTTSGYIYMAGFTTALGGVVVNSQDGGATFTTETVPSNEPLSAIDCSDDDDTNMWAVGADGAIYHGDGAGTWTTRSVATTEDLEAVYVDYDGVAFSYEGIAVGTNGYACYATDAVAGPWAAAATTENRNSLYGAWYENDSSRCIAVGDDGSIIKSVDEGVNWVFALGPANQLNDTGFADASNGWCVGTKGTIINTPDGGTNWNTQDSGVFDDLNGVHFSEDAAIYYGWAVGDGNTLLYSNDGGTSWTNYPDVAVNYNDVYTIISGLDMYVWAVGASGTVSYQSFAIAGVPGAWTNPVSGPPAEDLHGVSAFDTTNIWTVGVNGTIAKTINGGIDWSTQSTGVFDDLNGVCVADADNAWAVGDGGTIVNTTNGGTDWSAQTSGTSATLHDIQFGDRPPTDIRNGWVVGAYAPPDQEAVILATTDGGGTWSLEDGHAGIFKTLRGLDLAWNAGATSWDCYAAGDWGRVQKCTNADSRPVITPPLVPALEIVGNTVRINGTDFGATQATYDGHVYFAGGAEGVTGDWTDTFIDVEVPAGAYTGNVHVVHDGGSSNGENFTVEPSIAGVTPDPMSGGDAVTVTGEGFGDDPGAGNRSTASENVTVGAYQIPNVNVTAWSNTQIDYTLPEDVDPGNPVAVTVTAGGITSAGYNVEVQPEITSLTPNQGQTGETITVAGVNFGLDPGVGNRETATHNVTINTSTVPQMVLDAEVTSWAYNSIEFDIPYSYDMPLQPRSGDITVRSNSSTSAADTLTVLPKIDGVTPDNGKVGDGIDITGTCFGEPKGELSGKVYFNGDVAVAEFDWEDNAITDVYVPADATTGDVWVTTTDVTGTHESNKLPFNVNPLLGTLSKNMGRVGDTVTVTGTGFGQAQGAGTVTFNGVEATATAWGSASITVTVPEDATSGDVVVTTTGGSTTGENYTVMPKITSLTPDAGVPGDTVVTIKGYTYGANQGNSEVQFAGVGAGTADSWSRDEIKVKVPKNAASGEVVVSTADGVSNGMYFSVGPKITSIEPNNGPPGIEVTIKGENFLPVQGVGKVEFKGVDAGTASSWSDNRIEIFVPQGATTGDVVVTTTDGASNGFPFTVGLANTFYFAEGTTRPGFDQWICVMNPNEEKANVSITYMLSDGTTSPQLVEVDPKSRTTIKVIDAIGPDMDVSTKIESDQPIVAERPIYFNYQGYAARNWPGGHDVVGAVAPSMTWYFAEGTTRDGFDQWLCLQNPNDITVSVDITYMLQGGEVRVQTLEILPTSRETIDVRGFLGPNLDCSAKVSADAGIIVERPMYFNYQGYTALNWPGGHDVMGATSPATEWYFAEGTTRDGFDEWLCIQNPGPAPALVQINYMLGTGENPVQVKSVEAQGRITVSVADFLGRGQDVSMNLSSNQPIVAERSMYFNYVGLTGGHDVIGATAPATEWYFAEGTTRDGFDEWLCIQNPNASEVDVTITYMLGTGDNKEQVITVDPRSRATVDVNNAVGWGQDVSARVTCSEKIIVERPMYFNYMGKWTGGHDVVGFSW